MKSHKESNNLDLASLVNLNEEELKKIPEDTLKKILQLKLLLAVMQSDRKEITELVTIGINDIKADINFGEETNNLTALHHAISNDDIETVKVLINLGAGVNIPTRPVFPQNPDNSEHESIVTNGTEATPQKKLLPPPAKYPLNFAIDTHNVEMVELLLKVGADPLKFNVDGITLITPLAQAQENLKKGNFKDKDTLIINSINKALENLKNDSRNNNILKRGENKLKRVISYQNYFLKKQRIVAFENTDTKKKENPTSKLDFKKV